MIVIDASVVVQWLLYPDEGGQENLGRKRTDADWLAAPFLLDAEVTHAIRRLVLVGHMSSGRALEAISDFLATPVERFPHAPFLPRVFQLRDNASAYDALYIALAEALGAPLLTRDAALARVPGLFTTIEVVR